MSNVATYVHRNVVTYVHWTPDKLQRLKSAYRKAKDNGAGQFEFDTGETGKHTLLVDYAKYLIEYLETVVK